MKNECEKIINSIKVTFKENFEWMPTGQSIKECAAIMADVIEGYKVPIYCYVVEIFGYEKTTDNEEVKFIVDAYSYDEPLMGVSFKVNKKDRILKRL